MRKPSIDLKYDFAFKYLLGVDENKRFLIRFLNDVLQPDREIESVEIGNGENPGTYVGDKKSILDIRARTDTGTYVNIEIQVGEQQFIDKRMLYYWSKVYGSQLAQSEQYTLLNKTIGISILNYKLNANQSFKYHTKYALKELEKDFLLTDIMELHIIELPLFKDYFKKNDGNVPLKEDFWWLLLTAMNKNGLDEVIYNKIEELVIGGDDLMKDVMQHWHKMSKEEAERYWQEGLGQEMAYYDANIKKDIEIEIKENQLNKLIQNGKLSKDEIRNIIDLDPEVFEILYNRNKK
ncbi:Rpn family recombination-promoting nuclease/putative transposase [Guptibacillus sedimenti]|nr:Rpn family recombination-promoting nuclease/putative transposase [Pseudalkalibacillus sedimenti]